MSIKSLLFFLSILLLSFGCVEVQCSHSCGEKQIRQSIVPVESFVKIKKDTLINGTVETRTGSGSIIKVSETETLILTAKHVCQVSLEDFLKDLKLTYSLTVIDIDLNQYDGVIFKRSIKYDICIIKVEHDMHRPPLTISKTKPMVGERIFNMAQPDGIFYKRMVPIFDGFYTGDEDSDAHYSLPCKGGSSGSPVLNQDMEIVGMITKSFRGFEHMAMGIMYEDLIPFIEENTK